MYPLIFSDYPDIVTVRDLQKMLGISRHAVYDLLAEGELGGIRLGNAYRIPKLNVVRYVLTKSAGRPAFCSRFCGHRTALSTKEEVSPKSLPKSRVCAIQRELCGRKPTITMQGGNCADKRTD